SHAGHALRPDAGLIHHIHFSDDPVNVRLKFVTHSMPVEILEDVGLHLQFGRTDKTNLYPFELCQEIGERTRCASFVKLSDHGDAQAIERTLAIDGVQIEQRLRGMLPAVTISGIDDRHGRNLRRTPGAAFLVVPDYDYIRIAADDVDRVLDVLSLNLGGKLSRMLGRQDPA